MTARDSCAAEERDVSPERVSQKGRRRKDMTRNPELTRTLPLAPNRNCRSEHQSSSLAHARVDDIRDEHVQLCLNHRRATRGEIGDVAPIQSVNFLERQTCSSARSRRRVGHRRRVRAMRCRRTCFCFCVNPARPKVRGIRTPEACRKEAYSNTGIIFKRLV